MAWLKVRKKECNRGDSWRMNKDTRPTNKEKLLQGVTVLAWSNIKGHTLNKTAKEFVNSPRILQVKVLDLRTCTLSKMLLASTTSTSLQTAGRTRNIADTISRGASYQGLYYGTRWCTYRMNMVRGPVQRT
jgi:hypothetical protein